MIGRMPDERDVLLPYVTAVFGSFEPAEVRVSYDAAPRPTTPELDQLIIEEWERQTALARDHGRLMFNGELLRYIGHEVSEEPQGGRPFFSLTVGPTCYRDFVGTNLFNHHRLGEYGWHRFANPIGTTATLASSDGSICYGRRSARVAYHAGHIHTFGGALERKDMTAEGRVDVFASVLRELVEEVAVGPQDLQDLRCVGLIRDREIHQPEVLFEARLRMTAAELQERWLTAKEADEHDSLVMLPDQPGAIVPFIHGCGLIAPVAIGGLMLHGRMTWGEDWYSEAARKLIVR